MVCDAPFLTFLYCALEKYISENDHGAFVMVKKENIVTTIDEGDGFELVDIDTSAEDLLDLCKKELDITYPAEKHPLLCTGFHAKKAFIGTFEYKLDYCHYIDAIGRNQVRMKLISSIEDYYNVSIAKEYNRDFDMLLKPDINLLIKSNDRFNRTSLAYHFNKLLKMLGYVLKMKKIPQGYYGYVADSVIQEMFVSSSTNRGKYIFLLFGNIPRFLMTVLDDKMLFAIIEVLVEDLKKTPKYNGYLTKDKNTQISGINAPHCINVIKGSCAKLEDQLNYSFFAPKWKKFIFEE